MKSLLRGLRWWARQIDGDERWEEHVRTCAQHGHPPLDRRRFERHRADARARSTTARCC